MARISKTSANKLKALREIYPKCTINDILRICRGTKILDMSLEEIFPHFSLEKNEGIKRIPTKSWDSWPQELKNEIKIILEENDKGQRSISMEDYRGRIKKRWELDVSAQTLRNYVKTLGRKGWLK